MGHHDDADHADSTHASPPPDDTSHKEAPDEEPLGEGTNCKDQVYTGPEERRRAAALARILARHREKAGPGATKLPQRVVADAIGHRQSFVAKAEHVRCNIHMADLEQM